MLFSLQIFSSFQCLYVVRFELDIEISQRRYFYSSKLRLIVSKGGANSADLDALGFYFKRFKLLEDKLTT